MTSDQRALWEAAQELMAYMDGPWPKETFSPTAFLGGLDVYLHRLREALRHGFEVREPAEPTLREIEAGEFTLCRETARLAVKGCCPVHGGDACLEQFKSRMVREPPTTRKVMKYRKKPVVIEAFQFTGENLQGPLQREPGENKPVFIDTLEGRLTVSVGDWIITGVKGEHYPCKPDIFAATYEPAE